jgi:hypothetical protein
MATALARNPAAEFIDQKRKHHTRRHSGNRGAVIRNPVFSTACWIPGWAFSRPGMTIFSFQFNHQNRNQNRNRQGSVRGIPARFSVGMVK